MLGLTDDGRYVLLGLALVLIVGGGAVAWWGHTAGGTVEVRDVQFEGTNGTTMAGHLYVPEGVSTEDPAPGILAVHGYVNTKETNAPFAIEYARRGYVVLAIDQTGHGFSEPPAFTNGFGGPDGLAHLRSLDIVDETAIGMEGHSMGGWAITAAAATFPEGYNATVYAGSGPGPIAGFSAIPNGTAEFPRNMGLVFSEYDEFHWLMWPPAASAFDAPATEKMRSQFDTGQAVEAGRTYGDVSAGTGRRLYTPATTHPGDHLSTAAVADAVDWMQRTVPAPNERSPGNQVWFLKELGTLLATIGGVLFLFPAGALLLGTDALADVRGTPGEAAAERSRGWYAVAALSALVPVLTYYPAVVLGDNALPATGLFPQTVTNGVALWALVNAAFVAVTVGVWHYRSDRSGLARYGLGWPDRAALGKSLGVGVALAGALYGLMLGLDAAFTVHFRFWVFALKPMAAWHVPAFLAYLPVFFVFFVALGVLLHGRLRTPETTASLRRALATDWLVVVGGFLLLLVLNYVPLFLSGALPVPALALYTILAIQFVGALTIAALVSTYCFHLTGRVWMGAALNAVLVTWLVVASTATHVAV